MLTETTKLVNKWLLTGCAAASLFGSGCRSAMPGMGMFGMRSEPSAEALAGTGPSTTYPAPPSASASPESIASVAGGTAIPVSTGEPELGKTQVAGFDAPLPDSNTTNMAAAQANGFPATSPPSGYAFGSKAFTPKSDGAPAPASGTPSSYAVSPVSPVSATPTNYALPNKSAEPAVAADDTNTGFTLPAGISPALAAASEMGGSAATQDASTSLTSPPVPNVDMAPAAATAPSFSTASANEAVTAPSTSLSAPLPSNTSSGYSPGSTAGALKYPAGGKATPSASGSFYR